jgi:hypothetical protein
VRVFGRDWADLAIAGVWPGAVKEIAAFAFHLFR